MKKKPTPIVPLYRPHILTKTPTAQLIYNGGPLLTNVQIYTIFLGDFWQQPKNNSLVSSINAFFDAVLKSKLIDQLSEYNHGNFKINHGTRIGTLTIPQSLTKLMSDTQIQKLVTENIAAKKIPAANANLLYFVFTPSGTTVDQNGDKSCATFCGYHNDIDGKIFYAVIAYPDCAGCLGKLAPVDAMTSIASHELCEAITDPIPGKGWYDDANGEIGDICAWRQKKIGKFVVQQEWSNAKNRCL